MQLPQGRQGLRLLPAGRAVPTHQHHLPGHCHPGRQWIVNTYTGLASTDWKARLGVHKTSFKHKPKPGAKSNNGTELSTHIWELKDQNINHTLSWKILDRAQPFNPSTNMCRLCLTEKYYLMYNPEGATLNSRSEFYTACRHKKGMLISNG